MILPRPPEIPNWRLLAGQRDMLNRWVASYVTARRDKLTNPVMLTQDAVGTEVAASYIERVRSEEIEVPEGADTPELRFTLLRRIAELRWGPTEALQVSALLDPEIEAAGARDAEGAGAARAGSLRRARERPDTKPRGAKRRGASRYPIGGARIRTGDLLLP